LHYSLLVAVPFCYLELRRYAPRISLASLSELLRNKRTTFFVFVALLSLGGWLSIHAIHMNYYNEWLFARRQGITCLPMFFLATIYLLRRRTIVPVFLGMLLLGTSALLAFHQYSVVAKKANMNSEVLAQLRLSGKPIRNQELVQFLLEERSKKDKLTVVWTAHEPQLMAPYIPDVGFHWIYEKTTFEDVKIMFDNLGADYLLFNPKETGDWKFRRNNQKFYMAFEPVKNLSNFWIFVRKTGEKAEELQSSSSQNVNDVKFNPNSVAETSHRND